MNLIQLGIVELSLNIVKFFLNYIIDGLTSLVQHIVFLHSTYNFYEIKNLIGYIIQESIKIILLKKFYYSIFLTVSIPFRC